MPLEKRQIKLSFALSDSVTSFRVMADGFDTRGNLATFTTSIEAKRRPPDGPVVSQGVEHVAHKLA